jgi:hypothetical protein
MVCQTHPTPTACRFHLVLNMPEARISDAWRSICAKTAGICGGRGAACGGDGCGLMNMARPHLASRCRVAVTRGIRLRQGGRGRGSVVSGFGGARAASRSLKPGDRRAGCGEAAPRRAGILARRAADLTMPMALATPACRARSSGSPDASHRAIVGWGRAPSRSRHASLAVS